MPDRRSRLRDLTDAQLTCALHALVRQDRRLTARLLAHLAEVDARKLYVRHACSSMHVYCTSRLHMSDQQAYRRIQAARTGRRFPRVFEMVGRNELHLSGIVLLAPHLTGTNHDELLDAVVHKTKRQIELLLAQRFPQADAPTVVRRLPRATTPRPARNAVAHEPVPAGGQPAPAQDNSECAPSLREEACARATPTQPAVVRPTAPERYKVQFTASARLHAKLREAQDLLRHRIPNGDLAEVVERALDVLIETTRKRRFGETARPRNAVQGNTTVHRGRSRHIPNAIKRTVFERDQGRCTFVDSEGHRCEETGFIECHHRKSFASGGEHTVENLTLRCSAHNRYAAEQELGADVVAAKIRTAREAGTTTPLLAPGEVREGVGAREAYTIRTAENLQAAELVPAKAGLRCKVGNTSIRSWP